MKVNRGRLVLVLVLVVLIFAVLTGFYWDFVRDTIAVPVYFLLWLGDLLLKSVPQQVYLGILVLVCSVICLATLIGVRTGEPAEAAGPHRPPSPTRYGFWRKRCATLHTSRFSREQFAAEGRKLVLSLLAYEEGISASEAEALIRAGALAVPEPVRNLLEQQEFPVVQETPTAVDHTFERLRQLLRFADPPADPQLDRQVAEVIRFIEQYVEIAHAGNQPEA